MKKIIVEVFPKSVFGFAESHGNITKDLGYKLIMRRKVNRDLLNRVGGADAKVDKLVDFYQTLHKALWVVQD